LSKFTIHAAGKHQPQQFGPLVAHLGSQFGRFQRVLQRTGKLHEMNAAPADHVAVCDLYVSVALIPAQLDAGAELLTGGAHVATQVVGVAEAAQGQGLAFGRVHLAGEGQRLFVFGKTSVDVAKWKIDVAPQIVDPDLLVDETFLNSRSFGITENLQCPVVPVGNAQSFGHADQGHAPSLIIAGHRKGGFEGGNRVVRCTGVCARCLRASA
jgi:hypothetical protein